MANWEVTPHQVQSLLQQEAEFVLIDCRTPQERDFCAIQPSEFWPLQELNLRIEEFEHLKHKHVVIYCHHGVRSLQMAAMLNHHGFTDVKSMAGGIELWSLQIDANVPRY